MATKKTEHFFKKKFHDAKFSAADSFENFGHVLIPKGEIFDMLFFLKKGKN